MSTDAVKRARRALAGEFLDFAKVPGQSGKIAGGMAVEAIGQLVNAIIDEREAARTAPSPPPREEGDLLSALEAALDGMTKYSRDTHLSGEYLASLIWPIVSVRIAELEREREEAQARNDEHYNAAMGMSEKHRRLWVEATQAQRKAEAALADLRERMECVGSFIDEHRTKHAHPDWIMSEALALLTEAEGKTETATEKGGDPDRPAAETARTNIAPPARSGDEPPVPATYYPAVIEYPDAGRVEFVLRDGFSIYDKGEAYDIIRDGETHEVIGFAWAIGTNPALAAARSAGIEGSANDG